MEGGENQPPVDLQQQINDMQQLMATQIQLLQLQMQNQNQNQTALGWWKGCIQGKVKWWLLTPRVNYKQIISTNASQKKTNLF